MRALQTFVQDPRCSDEQMPDVLALLLRLLDLGSNPLSDAAALAAGLGAACKGLEVLVVPGGGDAGEGLHALPRLRSVNGQKWKRNPARGRAENGRPAKRQCNPMDIIFGALFPSA